ncbi:hypothetical protein [Massilibacterium senegalense]|uniref:hypothetical protein n=1 Tax=Massilibacterium senegalense TaxID=1632858 RepID=UPI00078042F9|nr:hypothetical protein [Massilibacterium senegalense]
MLFDPTAYENIKVVLEGAVYDQDLNGNITVSKRDDIVNLAAMNRRYHISFYLKNKPISAQATLSLYSDTEQLLGEILGWEEFAPYSAYLVVEFKINVKQPNLEQSFIDKQMKKIWGDAFEVEYTYSFQKIDQEIFPTMMQFKPMVIKEDKMDTMAVIVSNVTKSLEWLVYRR